MVPLKQGKGHDPQQVQVPFSELGSPPECFNWFTCLPNMMFLGCVSTIAAVLLCCFSPFILLLGAIQWMYTKCLKYHTPPSNIRVAVIGGGWSGMSCMSRLHELGVHQVQGFERNDSWGGTFHENLRYHSLQIHGAMWMTSFKDFPYSTDQDINDGKVIGEEAQNYMHRFGKEKNLKSSWAFDSRVSKIEYLSETRKANLTVTNSKGEERNEGLFDLIIYAAQASEPNIPNLPGRNEYKGKIYHSIDFKKNEFENIIVVNKNEKKKKVVIVGGSKTACDMALCFQRSGYESFSWLYRKPYIFWKYEAMFHNRSFLNKLRGLTTILGMLCSVISNKLGGLIFWSSGLAISYEKHNAHAHNDWKKFHFGILCPTQRRDLAKIPESQIIRDNPVNFTTSGLQLHNGTRVDADVIVFATGCESGLDKIMLEKDGKEFQLDPTTKMLDHFIFPEFPILANSTALWTTFGPVRAVNSAEMAVYHLCVRNKLSEEGLKHSAMWQFGGSTNSTKGWLFQSGTSAVQTFVVMHLDLLMRGKVNIFDLLWHMIEMFSLSKQNPLKMTMIPKLEKTKIH